VIRWDAKSPGLNLLIPEGLSSWDTPLGLPYIQKRETSQHPIPAVRGAFGAAPEQSQVPPVAPPQPDT
jgi:hypothetical protein